MTHDTPGVSGAGDPTEIDDVAQQVLEALPGTQNEIASRLGRPKRDQTVRRRLRRLEQVGRARRLADGVWFDVAAGPPLREATARSTATRASPSNVTPLHPLRAASRPPVEHDAVRAPAAYTLVDARRYPSDFDVDSRKLFDDCRDRLIAQKTWDRTEPEMLELYVRRLQIARLARAAITDEHGNMRLTSEGSRRQMVAHPMLKEMKDAENEAARLADELILTPESRRRHGVDPAAAARNAAADDGF